MAIIAPNPIPDMYTRFNTRVEVENLVNGRIEVITPLRLLKTICKGFSYRSRVHASCIKIDLNKCSIELAEWIYQYIKLHFFQVRLDLTTGNLYFNENTIKND